MWFHPHSGQTSRVYTRNSPYSFCIGSNSLKDLIRPEYCPSWSPKVYLSSTILLFLQIGHARLIASPWYLAARRKYGSASQASIADVLP